MGQTLHWFKWESGLTWITGMLLFILLYYRSLLFNQNDDIPAIWQISQNAAIGISVGMILAGWVIYDVIWKRCKNFTVGVMLCIHRAGRERMGCLPIFFRARRVLANRRDVRHHHGGERLDDYHSITTAHGERA